MLSGSMRACHLSSALRLARVGLTALLLLTLGPVVHTANVRSGFTESLVAADLANPTAMEFAPDGRLFVCEQAGRLRVVKDGALLPTPFVSLTVDAFGERGLLGVAFDPDFPVNGHVYVYYTAATPTVHNRISRFTADGDVALAGSEVVIFDLDPLDATNHNGGAIHFGRDGRLYVAVGDNGNGANAQTLDSLHGKILRISGDGTIPSDNPFYGSASGRKRAIWALGLRNPFTFSVQPGTGAMFINDVGEGEWEEIDEGVAGANYGWPDTEGYTSDPRFQGPRSAYDHAGGACAITGGAFYDPITARFPAEYVGGYFFADYCAGWIRRLDPASGAVEGFATGIPAPVDLKVSADGGLYYLARGTGSATGAVYRIEYGSSAPAITAHPAGQTARIGEPATFSVRASGTPPLGYQWQWNDTDIPGATAPDYTVSSVAQPDDGARLRAIVTNAFGRATSNEAVLTVTSNQPPAAAIIEPPTGTLYRAGEDITVAGSGTDPEDGELPPSAFTWQVDFHHEDHTHPFIQPTTGVTGGTITIPTTGETSASVWYRIHLTVRDSEGRTHTTQRDVLPRKSRITLESSPSGLQLKLDGQPITTPASFDGVVGMIRNLEASFQTVDGVTWSFDSWSDGGQASHDIAIPSSDTTYRATFAAATAAPPAPGLVGRWDMDAVSVSGNTVHDRSGLGNDGGVSGALLAAGVSGESLAFDGVDDRIDVRGAPALDTAAGFTVSFWYRADENRGSIVAKPYGPDWLNSWQFELDGPGLSFTSSDGSRQDFDGTAAPAAGAWVHVAGSWDGTTKRLFVNGAPVLAVARSIAMDAADVVIGGDYNGGEFVLPFAGRVDEVRVYDHALDEQQIQRLYRDATFASDTQGAVTRIEETSAAIAYEGSWEQGNADREWSGGAAAVSTEPSARATVSFTGTGVVWIGFRGPQAGIARVFLDGTLAATVDAFATAEEAQAALYAASGLSDAPHTLVIEVTGEQNPEAVGSYVVVDAFDVDA